MDFSNVITKHSSILSGGYIRIRHQKYSAPYSGKIELQLISRYIEKVTEISQKLLKAIKWPVGLQSRPKQQGTSLKGPGVQPGSIGGPWSTFEKFCQKPMK